MCFSSRPNSRENIIAILLMTLPSRYSEQTSDSRYGRGRLFVGTRFHKSEKAGSLVEEEEEDEEDKEEDGKEDDEDEEENKEDEKNDEVEDEKGEEEYPQFGINQRGSLVETRGDDIR